MSAAERSEVLRQMSRESQQVGGRNETAHVLVMLLLLGIPAGARPALAGILERSRAVDWGAGNQGVAGGIPNRTTICATLNPGATAGQINAAIAACPANQARLSQCGQRTHHRPQLRQQEQRDASRSRTGQDLPEVQWPDGCGGFAADFA